MANRRECSLTILPIRKRQALFWLTLVVVASFTSGILAAAIPAARRFVPPAAAAIMICAGLVFLSPFAISHPDEDIQRKARARMRAMGAATILAGVAELVPNLSLIHI